MSTRLSNNAKYAAQQSIDGLLTAGVQFLDVPLTDEGIIDLWEAMQPPDYVAAVKTIQANGVSLDYHLMDDDAAFYMHEQTGADLRLVTLSATERVFMRAAPNLRIASPSFTHPSGHHRNLSVRLDKQITITSDWIRGKLGAEKADEFFQWMDACSQMEAEIKSARKVVSDLFEMIKTAGQLRRMVPDLFKYMPEEQRKAFDDQKRASSFPFEWAAYPRDAVDRMLTTVLRCHLMQGTIRPRRQGYNVDRPGNWCKHFANVTAKYGDTNE